MTRIAAQSDRHRRRGSMTPAIAVAILTVGSCMALVFDRLWIDAAQVELAAAAEAAALAAAGRLAHDDLLRTDVDPAARMQSVRAAAGRAAARNRVAGRPVKLDTRAGRDVRLGLIVHSATGVPVFLETDHRAKSVLVTAQALRSRGNPIGLSGGLVGDAAYRMEASVDNRIVGVRPFPGGRVPGLPIAILEYDAGGQRRDTWREQIDGRAGADQFGFDSKTRRVVSTGDGIPEMVLHTAQPGETADRGNVQLVDLGNGLDENSIADQIRRGWSVEHLDTFNGEFRTDAGPQVLGSAPRVAGARQALTAIIGEPRICLLYREVEESPNDGGRTIVSDLVAGRVMQVRPTDGEGMEIVFQPTVIATRTAILKSPGAPWSSDPQEQTGGHPYIYKLHITQ